MSVVEDDDPLANWDPLADFDDGFDFKEDSFPSEQSLADIKMDRKLCYKAKVKPPPSKIAYTNKLAAKPLAAPGSFFKARIVHIIDPSQFYVIPERSWACICSSEESGSEWSHVNKLQDKCSKAAKMSAKPSLYFSVNELVLVEHDDPNICSKYNRIHHRGVITEEYYCDDEENPPNVKLTLLDFGIPLIKPLANVMPLDLKLTQTPPLVYKCSLYGVSPVGTGSWDKEAINRFKELSFNKVCNLEIKKVFECTVAEDPIHEMNTQVVLRSKDREGNYMNICKKLISSRLALPWNPQIHLAHEVPINPDVAFFIFKS